MFDSTSLLIGLITGSIGLGYFLYGKRQHNKVAFYSGLALMFYPYILSNTIAMIMVGIVLMAIPFFLKL